MKNETKQNEIVEDLRVKNFETMNFIQACVAYYRAEACDNIAGAGKVLEDMQEIERLVREVMTDDAPFSPSDLEAWGWEKMQEGIDTCVKFTLWKDGMRIATYAELDYPVIETFDDEGFSIGDTPIRKANPTQIEMQMLLNLITGEDNG